MQKWLKQRKCDHICVSNKRGFKLCREAEGYELSNLNGIEVTLPYAKKYNIVKPPFLSGQIDEIWGNLNTNSQILADDLVSKIKERENECLR